MHNIKQKIKINSNLQNGKKFHEKLVIAINFLCSFSPNLVFDDFVCHFFWHFSTILLLPQGIKFVSIVHSIKFDATRLVEVVVELWGLEQKSIRQLLVSLKNRNREKTFSLTFTIPSIINWLVKKKGQYCDAVSR